RLAVLCLSYCHAYHRDPPSFPTRRSSDLFDSLTSLYVISAMFGLFQGGIVPSYAIIVREAMPASEAATRIGIVIFASVFGMSFGDRKSTRLNSSHVKISYAVFCLKKKIKN